MRERDFIIVITIAFCIFWSFPSQAAKITQVKGGQVLIDTAGDVPIIEGAKYYVMIDGKKRGAVEVTKIKGAKAIAKILKGKADVDCDLQPISADGGSNGASSSSAGTDKSTKSAISYGGLVGLGMDSQTVTSPLTSVSTAMSGMGYSAKAFGDLQISGPLGVIARVGAEQLNLSGSGGATTNILYATGDVLLRYSFFQAHAFAPYVSLGLGLHLPIVKSSTILDTPNISSTMVFFGGLGASLNVGSRSYITVLGEYGYFPGTSYVTTDIIAFRAGLGFRY